MPGGEIQLVAYGEENMFLNDNPQITFYNPNTYDPLHSGPTFVSIYDLTIKPTGGSSITTDAELQDSYLSLSSYTKSRHAGVKITSAKYNEYTKGDSGSYGLTSAIDKYQSFFLTFKGMSGAYPELVNKSTMYVNSLVDDKGEQITVGGTSSIYYANLLDNFGKDSFAGITINNKTTGKTLHQDTTIYRPGSGFPNVILTNESGSNSYPVPTYSTASILFRQQVDGFGTGSSAYFPSGSVIMYDTFGFIMIDQEEAVNKFMMAGKKLIFDLEIVSIS